MARTSSKPNLPSNSASHMWTGSVRPVTATDKIIATNAHEVPRTVSGLTNLKVDSGS